MQKTNGELQMNVDSGKYKNKIITIPNILSLLRLCLIPVIVWLYKFESDYPATLLVLLLSAVTDIVDGIIARKFNMISDFGKAFDPIADKLTQTAMLYCLISRFPYMILPLVFLVIKEVFSGITGIISIVKTNTVKGSVWHGKLTTVALYAMMSIHLVWFDIPELFSVTLVTICIAIMLASFILYTVRNLTAIKNGFYKD